MGDEGEGSRQPPSSRLSPRTAPPAAPGSASRTTTAGRGGGGEARGASAPGRGGAPLTLLTRGAVGSSPSSAPASKSAPVLPPPAPLPGAVGGARVTCRRRRAVPPGSCSLRLCGLKVRSLPFSPPERGCQPRDAVGTPWGRRNPPREISLASDPPWVPVGRAGRLEARRRRRPSAEG